MANGLTDFIAEKNLSEQRANKLRWFQSQTRRHFDQGATKEQWSEIYDELLLAEKVGQHIYNLMDEPMIESLKLIRKHINEFSISLNCVLTTKHDGKVHKHPDCLDYCKI